jgi:hypothetical protein
MDILTIVSAGIALVSAVAASWQANEAKKSRKATERQAAAAEETLRLAREQTESAERSAKAAERQAEEARHANKLTQQDRDEKGAPRLQVGAARKRRATGRTFDVVMEEGAAATVSLLDVRSANEPPLDVSIVPNQDEKRIVKGGKVTFDIEVPPADRAVYLEVQLECTEIDGGRRSWVQWYTLAYRAPARVW